MTFTKKLKLDVLSFLFYLIPAENATLQEIKFAFTGANPSGILCVLDIRTTACRGIRNRYKEGRLLQAAFSCNHMGSVSAGNSGIAAFRLESGINL